MQKLKLKLNKPYPKQEEFMRSKTRYTAYGGARGGGKSEAVRTKAILLALNYPGIQILLVRRTYQQVVENHAIALQKKLKGIANFNKTDNVFKFINGSRLILGYCDNEADVLRYQGQAYECIFLEEATHLTEFQFQCFTECNRPSGLCSKQVRVRMYLTCNPGGVGHSWVKRLFVDRDYKDAEDPNDYSFIPAKVYDNKFILEHDKDYVKMLENLPEDRRRAMLDGDWDVFTGQYFPEFRRDVHVCEPFLIPDYWTRYRCIDYGLDMLAVYHIALSQANDAYIYKEIYESGLIVSEAARIMKSIEDENERNIITYAPGDLWNRQKDTGKSVKEIFADNGVYFLRAENKRESGWLSMKEWLKVYEDENGNKKTRVHIFSNCTNLIRCLPQVQYSDKNPNDISTEPHELTHSVDSVRYFFASRPAPPVITEKSAEEIIPYALRSDDDEGIGLWD